ncbi:MAG: VWA domain-containing protein [Desulfotomaculaceae bacterium]|nr:VWA domain-containing protein [Desulfotomaculaceae bacterium]
MIFIEHDEYDQLYFSYLERKYKLNQDIDPQKIDIYDRDMLFNLYNILFKEYYFLKELNPQELTLTDRIKYLTLKNISNSFFIKDIKRFTTLNEYNSYFFIKEMVCYLDELDRYEDNKLEEIYEKIDMLNSYANAHNQPANHTQPGNSQQEPGKSSAHTRSSSISNQLGAMQNNLVASIDQYISANLEIIDTIKTNSKYDVAKRLNMFCKFNQLAEHLKETAFKQKKAAPVVGDAREIAGSSTQTGSSNLFSVLAKIEEYNHQQKDLSLRSFEKMIEYAALKIKEDFIKRKEIYNSIRNLRLNNYWDLSFGKLIQTNPDFCTYIAEIIKKHPEILDIIKYVGNLQDIKEKKRKKTAKSTFECKIKIQLSNDLANIVPFSLLYLDDDLIDLFYNNYMENKLYTYDYEAKDYRGKGGVIVCLDTSGSMYGENLEILKAIVLTMALGALRKKRYFCLINFSNEIDHILLLPRKPDFIGFFKLLTSSYYGGTNFDKPIQKALEIIKKHKKHRSSDVFFFTDGFGYLSKTTAEQFVKYKKEYEFNLLVFLIDIIDNNNILMEYCDKKYVLSSSKILTDILAALKSRCS